MTLVNIAEKVAPPLFFGFTRSINFCMATPEKAILDTLYYRKGLPARDELELEQVNFDLLRKMAEKFPSSVSKESLILSAS